MLICPESFVKIITVHWNMHYGTLVILVWLELNLKDTYAFSC